MFFRMRLPVLLLLVGGALQPSAGLAVTVGQIDTFQDGTTQNWVIGTATTAGSQPVNVPTGGPLGAGDAFLRLIANAAARSGNKLTVINSGQWAGNYLGSVVDTIEMDVLNMGTTPLALRLFVSDPVEGFLRSGDDLALSAVAVPVPVPAVPGTWSHVVFPIDPASLIAGRGTVQDALLNATDVRIFHNPAPAFPGPLIDAQLGVDNIRAVGTGTAPVANGGPNQRVHVGAVVQLDASASTDLHGHTPLTYAWSLIAVPAGSTATLSNPVAVNPTFVADKIGQYRVQLTTTNSVATANPFGRVSVQALNTRPIANAGRSRSLRRLRAVVTLDGSLSADPDGDPITYRWTFASKPKGSRALLKRATTARPTFVPDKTGTYVVRLLVKDPYAFGEASLVSIKIRR